MSCGWRCDHPGVAACRGRGGAIPSWNGPTGYAIQAASTESYHDTIVSTS
jgi:hypothetical protein